MAETTTNPTADASLQLQGALSATFAAADATAAKGLQTIGKVHRARVSRLNRQAVEMTGLDGASTQAEIAAETVTAAKFAMLALRAVTTAPTVTGKGWALHGRLYSSDLAPAAGSTVFLVDAQNAFQAAYGFAYTDATGYFALTADSAPSSKNGESATAPPARLFVAAADAKGEPIYRSATPFIPTPGIATYQAHVMPSGGKPIGDPPANVRDSALPKRS